MSSSRPRILVITRHTPLPGEDGASEYLSDLLRFLSGRGWDIHLAWTQPHDNIPLAGVWRRPEGLDFLAGFYLPKSLAFGSYHVFPQTYTGAWKARTLYRIKMLLRLLRLWRRPDKTRPAMANGESVSWMALANSTETQFADEIGRRLQPSVVMTNYPWLNPVFDGPSLKQALLVCTDLDVAWQRAEHLQKLDAGGSSITRQEEAELLSRARIVVAISKEDAEEFSAMSPSSRVVTAPKAWPPVPVNPQKEESQHLLFVGSSNHFNVEGLIWFLEEVWPLLRSQYPKMTMGVCGTIEQTVSLRPPGVTFEGRVADLSGHYARATAVIIPLRRATGLNIKLVEAVAHGKACVATPVVLRSAIYLRDCVVEAEEANEFVAAISQLIAEPAERAALGAKARVAAQQHFSADACYGELAGTIQQELEKIKS